MKKRKTQPTRHTLRAKGIIVLLSLIILVFIASFAWYIDADIPVTSSGISISTRTTSEFHVAIGFSTPDTNGYKVSDWLTTNSLNFTSLPVTGDSSSPYNLLGHFAPVDLTGDGVTLIRPEMLSKNSGIDLSKDTYEIPTPNKEYISFDLIIRSSSPSVNVKLTNNSYVLGAIEGTSADTEPDNSKLVISSGDSKSSYGNFSEDSVVGAVRMSFVNYTNDMNTYEELMSDNNTLQSTPELLWIPRPDIYLKSTNNINDWQLIRDTDSNWNTAGLGVNADGSTASYKTVASTHYYYGIFNANPVAGGAANYATVSSAVSDLTSNGQTIVSTQGGITHTDNNKLYYYGKCRVYIWVDGCDAEARRAIDKGQFWFKLSLSAN